MSGYYPPGVTGNEPQIDGDRAFEALVDQINRDMTCNGMTPEDARDAWRSGMESWLGRRPQSERICPTCGTRAHADRCAVCRDEPRLVECGKARWAKYQPVKMGTQPSIVRFRQRDLPLWEAVQSGRVVEFQVMGETEVRTGIVQGLDPIPLITLH